MNPAQIQELVKGMIQQYLTTSQYSATQGFYHTHNGIDSPKLNFPTGGGGTPGGNNTDIQFNDNGAFGGSDNFTFDSGTNILTVTGAIDIEGAIISQDNNLNIEALKGHNIAIVTVADTPGDSGSITIASQAAQTTGALSEVSGDVNITTGFGFGDAGDIKLTGGFSLNGVGGGINLQAGGSSTFLGGSISLLTLNGGTAPGGITVISSGAVLVRSDNNVGNSSPVNIQSADTTTANPSGAINIKTGNTSQTGTVGGQITIETGAQSDFGFRSNINLKAGSIILTSETAGPTQTHSKFTTGNDNFYFEFDSHTADAAGAQGGLAIADVVNPPSGSPSAGGVLYSSGGALHWLGSNGTDTVIAPA